MARKFDYLTDGVSVPSVPNPDPTWKELLGRYLNNDYAFTPDQFKLDQYQHQYVFVADELMKPFPLHNNFFEGSKLECIAYTKNKFSTFIYKLPDKPNLIILPNEFSRPSRQRVRGELFLVPAWRIHELDQYKQNGEVFQRLRVRVAVPNRKIIKPRTLFDNRKLYFYKKMWYNIPKKALDKPLLTSVRAWMYVAIPSYWLPLLDGGYMFSPLKPLESRNKQIGQYYFFTRKDYNRTT